MAINLNHPSINIARQCELLGLGRSTAYYRHHSDDSQNEQLMRLIDQQYLETPFYGVRRMTAHLQREGPQAGPPPDAAHGP